MVQPVDVSFPLGTSETAPAEQQSVFLGDPQTEYIGLVQTVEDQFYDSKPFGASL